MHIYRSVAWNGLCSRVLDGNSYVFGTLKIEILGNTGERENVKKEEIYISHVLFPWETFSAQAEREQREKEQNGARWTEDFLKEIRSNILLYADMKDLSLRNSLLNEVYKMCPFHFREELFAGVSFPEW